MNLARAACLALIATLVAPALAPSAATSALAAAPWRQETRDGTAYAVAGQGGLELAVACQDGRLVMTYSVPREALAAALRDRPKVYLVLDYDGAGIGLYWWYETRLTDSGAAWVARPLPDAVADNIRMLAAARTDIRVGLSASEPEIGFTLQNESRIAAKGSHAAVKPAMQQCGVPIR